MTELGEAEAKKGGEELKKAGYTDFDMAFTSDLTRAQKTLEIQLKEIGQTGLTTTKSQALNERDYGDLTGLNKDDARKEWGEEQVKIWRRSFSIAPPGKSGESLKMTAERVLPYYEATILPEVLKGKKVLVTAHGNSLRALIMRLEGLTGEEIANVGECKVCVRDRDFSDDDINRNCNRHPLRLQNRRRRKGIGQESARVN